MGTGSAYSPEYLYVCDVCGKSFSRDLSEDGEEVEMGCHTCMKVVCPKCQVEKDGKKMCPDCGDELEKPIF